MSMTGVRFLRTQIGALIGVAVGSASFPLPAMAQAQVPPAIGLAGKSRSHLGDDVQIGDADVLEGGYSASSP